jgi:hypothetical protein
MTGNSGPSCGCGSGKRMGSRFAKSRRCSMTKGWNPKGPSGGCIAACCGFWREPRDQKPTGNDPLPRPSVIWGPCRVGDFLVFSKQAFAHLPGLNSKLRQRQGASTFLAFSLAWRPGTDYDLARVTLRHPGSMVLPTRALSLTPSWCPSEGER